MISITQPVEAGPDDVTRGNVRSGLNTKQTETLSYKVSAVVQTK